MTHTEIIKNLLNIHTFDNLSNIISTLTKGFYISIYKIDKYGRITYMVDIKYIVNDIGGCSGSRDIMYIPKTSKCVVETVTNTRILFRILCD